MTQHTVFEWPSDVDSLIEDNNFHGLSDVFNRTKKPCGWMSTAEPTNLDDAITTLFSKDTKLQSSHILNNERATWLAHWLALTSTDMVQGTRLHFLTQSWNQPGFHPFATLEQCTRRLSQCATQPQPGYLPYIIRLSATQPGAFTVTYINRTKSPNGEIYSKRYYIIGSYIVNLTEEGSVYPQLDHACEIFRPQIFKSFSELEEEIKMYCQDINRSENIVSLPDPYLISPDHVNGFLFKDCAQSNTHGIELN